MEVEENPYVIGDFVWTAIDYIGEASIGWLGYFQSGFFFPWNLAFCGDIDICGWKRPQSFYRDVLWKKNQLSVFVKPPIPSFKLNPNIESWSKWNWMDALPEWNWKVEKNTPMEVSVYSSCEEAELFFNGKSLGRKLTNQSTQFMASWIVTYQPGEIKAVGYSAGKIIKQTHITTADKVDKIKLTADRKTLKADNQDLSYITVELVDKQGNINPEGEKMINFSVSGDAEIVGVGNANPVSLESYQQQKRKTWKGKCLVIIKAGKKAGSISLFAKSTGMKPSKIILESK
jgi:beta-galactosidase